MDNARSYGARLGGLLFFLLALAIVGVLVYLTVRSARDDDNQTASQDTTSEQTPAEENSGEQPQSEQPAEEQPAEESAPSEGNDNEGNVASETEDQTATDEEGVIDDEAASTTREEQESEDEDSSQVAGAQNGEPLPNTGPESAIFAAIGIGLVLGAIHSYRHSGKMLKSAILK